MALVAPLAWQIDSAWAFVACWAFGGAVGTVLGIGADALCSPEAAVRDQMVAVGGLAPRPMARRARRCLLDRRLRRGLDPGRPRGNDRSRRISGRDDDFRPPDSRRCCARAPRASGDLPRAKYVSGCRLCALDATRLRVARRYRCVRRDPWRGRQAPWLTRVFGASFQSFQYLIWPVGVAQLVSAVGIGFGLLLIVEGRGSALLASTAIVSVASLTLLIVFGELYGLKGAAWALTGSAALGTVLVFVLARRAPRRSRTDMRDRVRLSVESLLRRRSGEQDRRPGRGVA